MHSYPHHQIGIFNFFTILVFAICFSMPLYAKPVGHAQWVGENLQGAPCIGGAENFGPFDYLNRHKLRAELGIVEKYHFGPEVEQLIAGMRTGLERDVPAELDYTLRAWPNHHRALNSAIQFRMIHKNRKTGFPPAECYLERAINFSPKDGITRMLYGNLLQRSGHKKHALEQYEQALKLRPNNVQIKYNLALLLVDLGKYKRAREYALELYPKGFPLPGLREKLKKAGHWSQDDNIKKAESSGVSEVQ